MTTPGRLQRSCQLFLSSLRVLSAHRKLLLFPLVAGALSLGLCAFFLAAPVAAICAQPTGHAWTEAAHWNAVLQHPIPETMTHNLSAWGATARVYGALIYLTSMFAATFCNVAFYHQIARALADEPVSLRAGFAFARRRLRAILFWSLFAGTIGLVIRALEERFGWLGKLVFGVIGAGWSVASVFAIPAMIREDDPNPVRLLKHSAGVLRKTWGESLAGFLGFSALSTLVTLAVLGVIAGAIGLGVALPQLLIVLGPVAVLAFVALLAFSYAAQVAGGVYRGALYLYASEGVVPEAFSAADLDAAWKVRGR